MAVMFSQDSRRAAGAAASHRPAAFLITWARSIVIFTALLCTISVKLFHACRTGLAAEFPHWILDDIAVLLTIEACLAVICFRLPSKLVLRSAIFLAVIIFSWSVMNAGWIIRTGTQILPTVLLQLIRTPLDSIDIVVVNLAKMPLAAATLLIPSVAVLAYSVFAMAKAPQPSYDLRLLTRKIPVLAVIIFLALLGRFIAPKTGSSVTFEALRFNSQLRALTNSFHNNKIPDSPAANQTIRNIPTFDQLDIKYLPGTSAANHNVVIVVLEGIQYHQTSLGGADSDLTPYLAELANQGVEFTNSRCTVTHTTKALFSLLTGRFPSVSQDFIEAVPAEKPYVSLATILKQKAGFRTAFFQSAKGSFECRPGLVHNLGFEKFWAREDLDDPNFYLGYLAADEFQMLRPIAQWIKADKKPFFLTVLCSASHDPYLVPHWFAEPAEKPLERYLQTVRYTDKFIEALDGELEKLDLNDNTIFCVIGDHGEAFAEHDQLGHERIVFDEVLRLPWIIRAKDLISPAKKIHTPVSSIDLAPTILALLNFDVNPIDFDGVNALAPVLQKRNVYFSSWIQPSPTGFIRDNIKYIYFPANNSVVSYDLGIDPDESTITHLENRRASQIVREIITWRNSSFIASPHENSGRKTLFNHWQTRWNKRVPAARHIPES